jgi:CheY-like chemotaxis protein
MVEAALEITEYSLRTAGISVRGDFAVNLPPVLADPDQMIQVLVNLIVNSQQSMEGGDLFEKTLTIRTSVSQSGMALADISDTGPGVPPELRCRIFDPFFTTKPQGSGTGIGLSFSLGIVQAHGGMLMLEPSRRGALFRLALPPAGGLALTEATPLRGGEAPDRSFRRILLVEDEEDVSATLAELLEREGFSVTVAADGTQAFYALDNQEFDLLFSDLRMPLLNGRELYDRLCEIRPQLVSRMAFVTGNTIDNSMTDFLKSCGRPVMEKPFTRAGLRATLAALTGPEPSQ